MQHLRRRGDVANRLARDHPADAVLFAMRGDCGESWACNPDVAVACTGADIYDERFNMINLSALESAARAATPLEISVRCHMDPMGDDDAWYASGPFTIPQSKETAQKHAAYLRAVADPATVLALVRIARATAEYELLRYRDLEHETYEEWAAIATQLHANLLVALRDGGVLP